MTVRRHCRGQQASLQARPTMKQSSRRINNCLIGGGEIRAPVRHLVELVASITVINEQSGQLDSSGAVKLILERARIIGQRYFRKFHCELHYMAYLLG